MQVWEAINILESLDPKSEVTLVISKLAVNKAPQVPMFTPNPYDKTHVIGKDQWVQPPPGYPAWHNTITCTSTKH